MSPEEIQSRIDRALKGLPELDAPGTLVSRVIAAIERRARLPWYRQAWQVWPMPAQAVALGLLVTLFGGLCYAGAEVGQAQAVVAGFHKVAGWLAGIGALAHAAIALLSAIVLSAKQLGTGFLVASFAAVLLGYATCLGLGTVYFRLGWARRMNGA